MGSPNSRHLFLLLAAISQITVRALPGDLPPDVVNMARAMNVNRDLLKDLPDFTCLETIERDKAAKNKRKIERQDIVQVEVAVGGHHELFSWPGQNSFSDTGLAEMVGHGLTATGLFESFARNLFVGRAGVVTFIGQDSLHARPAYHFTYKTSSLQGNLWEVDWLGARGDVGEEGEFWVDASEFTLLRLDVNAVDFPSTLPLKHLEVTIDYQPVSAGTGKTLLPTAAEVVVTEVNGEMHRENVLFSHCRVFGAESTFTISAEKLAEKASQLKKTHEVLAPGLKLPLTLETPVDSATARIGDAIRARLDKAVALPGKQAIPKGAIAEGYVRELERHDDRQPYYLVGLEFDQLDWPGHSAEFFAEAIALDPIAQPDAVTSGDITRNISSPDRTIFQYTTERTYYLHIPGVANFILDGAHVQIPKGFRMVWLTQEAARRREREPAER